MPVLYVGPSLESQGSTAKVVHGMPYVSEALQKEVSKENTSRDLGMFQSSEWPGQEGEGVTSKFCWKHGVFCGHLKEMSVCISEMPGPGKDGVKFWAAGQGVFLP